VQNSLINARTAKSTSRIGGSNSIPEETTSKTPSHNINFPKVEEGINLSIKIVKRNLSKV